MYKKMKWGIATLILILLGMGVFFITSELDFAKFKEKMGIDGAKETESAEHRDTVEAESGEEPSLLDPVDAGSPSENVPNAETQTEYATEVEGYEKDGVEGMYVTHIPRDPSRFAHLPPPPLPPSAVPADCPEHLRLPPEWIDGVYRGIEPNPANDQFDQYAEEMLKTLRNNVFEIIRDYNPKRPYVEIWDQFIEYEKMYRAYAEWELGYTPVASPAAGRVDWQYEQMWAFPEFIEWVMSTGQPYGEEDRFETAVEVAMGYIEPGWNKITLEDGRDFFIKGNTRYEFAYSGITEDGNEWGRVTGFSRVRLTDSTPVVRIDVSNTSDEKLTALMGWDYTMNPLTMQPLVHDSSHVTIYPRMMGVD